MAYLHLSFKIKNYLIIFFISNLSPVFILYSLGLDVEKCHIIEMACLITDENLNIIKEVKADE